MVVSVQRVGNVAVCRVRGVPTPHDVTVALKEARSIGARYDLWDLAEAKMADWDEATLDGLSSTIREHVAEHATLVVPDKAMESLGTEIASKLDDDGVPVTVSVFTDQRDAIAWLWRLHRGGR